MEYKWNSSYVWLCWSTSSQYCGYYLVLRVRQKFLDTEKNKYILYQETDLNQVFNITRFSYCLV